MRSRRHHVSWAVVRAVCQKKAHVGAHVVGGSGTMQYKLPNDVECEHCVLQWYWATANSCASRGFLDFFERYNKPFGTTCPSDGGGIGAHGPGMEAWHGRVWGNGSARGVLELRGCAYYKGRGNRAVEPLGTSAAATPTPAPTSSAQDPSGGHAVEVWVSASPLPLVDENGISVGQQGGRCVRENEKCAGNVSCREEQQLCVYVDGRAVFSCRFWWSVGSDE